MSPEAQTQPRAEEILRTRKTFALVGATQDMLKYSYELMFTLLEAGYRVYPVNPRYDKIEEEKCYGTLAELPEVPDVVLLVLSPPNVERMIGEIADKHPKIVWLPPGSWSKTAVETAESLGMETLYDICPIGTLKKMNRK